MERVRKTYYKEKEILILDYSECKGDGMIKVYEQAKQLVLNEKKRFLILSIFSSKTFVSPEYLRHIEKDILKVDEFIEKQAVIGLSQTQIWILKGINLWYRKKIYSYNSLDEALEFLIKENDNKD